MREQIKRRNDKPGGHRAQKNGRGLIAVVQQKSNVITGNQIVRRIARSKLARLFCKLRVGKNFASFRRN